MSSLTIEVDDPEDAYENLRAMLDAAPVEFSQVTSVRLELEYEPAADDDTDAAGADAGADVAATPEGDEAATGPTAADFGGSATGADDPEPPIADAETPAESSESTSESAVDGADEITFRKPDEGADDEDDETQSVFGDAPEDSGTDSVFATPDDAVTFDEPDADAGTTAKTTDDGRQLGDAVDRSTAGGGSTGDATDTSPDPTESTSTTDRQERAANPSPQTYNKVVRLLQNRDFPIERSEIEDVAVGAYDVDVDQCRAVIDAAIDKGLVAQQGSKLVDPTE